MVRQLSASDHRATHADVRALPGWGGTVSQSEPALSLAATLLSLEQSEMTAFIDKLGQFRGTLRKHERRLLDRVVLGACGAVGEVRGYAAAAACLEQLRGHWLILVESDK